MSHSCKIILSQSCFNCDSVFQMISQFKWYNCSYHELLHTLWVFDTIQLWWSYNSCTRLRSCSVSIEFAGTRMYIAQTKVIRSIHSCGRLTTMLLLTCDHITTSNLPLKVHWALGHIKVMIDWSAKLKNKTLQCCFSTKKSSIAFWSWMHVWLMVKSLMVHVAMYNGSLTMGNSNGRPPSSISYLLLNDEGELS